MINNSEKASITASDQQEIQMAARLTSETPQNDVVQHHQFNGQFQFDPSQENQQSTNFQRFEDTQKMYGQALITTEADSPEKINFNKRITFQKEEPLNNFKHGETPKNHSNQQIENPLGSRSFINRESIYDNNFEYMRIKTTEGGSPHNEGKDDERTPLEQAEKVTFAAYSTKIIR
jgi:hypothetical protein